MGTKVQQIIIELLSKRNKILYDPTTNFAFWIQGQWLTSEPTGREIIVRNTKQAVCSFIFYSFVENSF